MEKDKSFCLGMLMGVSIGIVIGGVFGKSILWLLCIASLGLVAYIFIGSKRQKESDE